MLTEYGDPWIGTLEVDGVAKKAIVAYKRDVGGEQRRGIVTKYQWLRDILEQLISLMDLSVSTKLLAALTTIKRMLGGAVQKLNSSSRAFRYTSLIARSQSRRRSGTA